MHNMATHPIINKMSSGNTHPLIMEIVGPAGAGKTTLIRVLCEQNNQIRQGVSFPKIRRLPSFISNTVLLLPTYLRHYRHSRWFSWKELRSIVNLKLWHRILANQSSNHKPEMTVFDHGPIFRLAHLREFGPEVTKSPVFERWWNQVLSQWVNTLDVVVWLDAPNETLLERVQGRGHGYLTKEISTSEGYEFLERYRKTYEHVLAKFVMNQELTLLHFKTDWQSPEQIADEIRVALESKLSLINDSRAAVLPTNNT